MPSGAQVISRQNMLAFKAIENLSERWRAPLLVLILAPLAVATVALKPAWDEIFFLHNGVCVAYSIGHGSLSGLDKCLSEMAKSPIMAFLLVPAGAVQGDAAKLNVAPVVLALLCFSQIILLAYLSARAKISALALIVAAVGAVLSRPLWENGAPFMVDGFLSLVIANTMMLFVVEARDPRRQPAQLVCDGLLWGTILSLGVLSKLTYCFFAALFVTAALILSYRNSGWRPTIVKAGFAFAAGLPAAVMLFRYGHLYWAHAAATSFGGLSAFYDDHLSRAAFIRETISSIVPLGLAALVLLIWSGCSARGRRADFGVAAYAIAGIVAYFILASGSPNKDPRFFWPVWLALPLSLSIMVPPKRNDCAAGSPMWTILPIVLAVALSLQSFGRFNLTGINEAVATLGTIPPDHPITVLMATDEPFFNIEALLLAKKLNYAVHSNKTVGTVVYDIAQNLTVAQSIAKLEAANYVVGRFPAPVGAPEWTNRFSSDFERSLTMRKRPLSTVAGHPTVSVYGPVS
jgi:hypothetical protein